MVERPPLCCRHGVASPSSTGATFPDLDLHGHVAVVTGAGRGIGRASAIRLALAGARVAVVSRSPATVDAAVAEIHDRGGDGYGVTCDVSEHDQLSEALGSVVGRWGYFDIVVNCAQGFGSRAEPAATTPLQPLEFCDDEVWDYTLRSGLWATLWTMKAGFRHMRDRGWGRVVNFGSPAGQFGQAGNAPYNTTKEAIRALTRTAATRMGAARHHGQRRQPLGSHGRYGGDVRPAFRGREPSRGSSPCRSNASERPRTSPNSSCSSPAPSAAYITGETINVDSGLFIRP